MLTKRIAWLLACFLVFASAVSLPAAVHTWDFLGDTKIDGTRDHDTIRVTRRNGVFQAIQLRVSGDAIFFDRIVVYFGDGTSKELAVQERVWPEGKNRIISFSGEPRVVESVELWYYKEPWEHTPRVILYGS